VSERPPEFLRVLAAAVDLKADYFPGHSDGVAYLLRLMGTEAGFDERDINRLFTAALLHDVGKIMLPEAVLAAPRPLSLAEFALMERHVEWSAVVASSSERTVEMAPWVLHHHERWDGKGYPAGLSRHEIPMPSRMLLVADAFHVMTNARPYQPARSRSEALEEIQDKAGTQFCPEAVAMLCNRASSVMRPFTPVRF